MNTLQNVVIDEARWPRIYANLRRAGFNLRCSCNGCASCQARAKRFMFQLAHSAQSYRSIINNRSRHSDIIILRKQVGSRCYSLFVRTSSPPRIIDLNVDSPPIKLFEDTEYPEEEIRGPVNVSINWTSNPVPLNQVAAHRKKGGVYILLNQRGNVLKAGEGDFAARAKVYRGSDHQGKQPDVVLRPSAMYLGTLTIDSPSRYHKATVLTVERVITRTLFRLHDNNILPRIGTHRALPLEGQSANILHSAVINYVKVNNVIPRRLVPDIRVAYAPGQPHRYASPRNLYLTTTQSNWEF